MLINSQRLLDAFNGISCVFLAVALGQDARLAPVAIEAEHGGNDTGVSHCAIGIYNAVQWSPEALDHQTENIEAVVILLTELQFDIIRI